MRAIALVSLLLLAVSNAQNYKCDWNVVGIGGGDMSGSYRCSSTVGQTAAGLVTSSNCWALIGFWQPEGQTGVQEQAYSPNQGPLLTRLCVSQPNPFRTHLAIRYSLAAEGLVTLRVHDLTGRVVKTLGNGVMLPGRYSLSWNGTDDRGRELTRGVYFLRLDTPGFREVKKAVVAR